MLTSCLRDSRRSFLDFINIHFETWCIVLLKQLVVAVVAARMLEQAGGL